MTHSHQVQNLEHTKAGVSSAGFSSRRAWGIVGLLWVAYCINYTDRQDVFSIFPVLKRELHLTDLELGLIGSVFNWVYSLCMPLAGYVADLMRRDRVILMSLILWSLATLGTSFSRSIASFLGWRALVGASESLYVPAAIGLIAVAHSTQTRSKALGAHATAQFAGIILGGWYGGWTAEKMGWRNGFLVPSLIGIGYALILAPSLRAEPAQPRQPSINARNPFAILRSYCYLALTLAFFMFCLMLWVLYGWFPSFIYEHYGFSLAASGLNATLYLQTSTVAGVMFGGALADWLTPRVSAARFYIGAGGLLGCAPFSYLALVSTSFGRLRVASCLFGLLAGVMIANVFASAYDVVAERNYGFAAGFLNFAGGLAGGIGLILAGWWNPTLGLAGIMRWAGVGSACTASLMIVIVAVFFENEHRKALASDSSA